VGHLDVLCHDWFMAEPSLTTFTLRAIFHDLFHRWDDSQAVETASHLPFKARLLPGLLRVTDMLALNKGEQELLPALAGLVKSFRDCCRDATPP
jgi:hypothetical protein